MIAKGPKAYKDRVLKAARYVYDYANRTNAEVDAMFEAAPKNDKKEFMIWVNENVRKEIQGFVRCKYYGKKYHVLKKSHGYLKLKDMGITEYKGVFENEE